MQPVYLASDPLTQPLVYFEACTHVTYDECMATT